MTSFMFLLIGLVSFLITKNNIYFKFLPGYIFCFLGDYFLAIAKTPNGILKKNKFLVGLGLFALAHVMFIGSFVLILKGEIGYIWLICATIGCLFMYLKKKKGKLDFKGSTIPCLIYCAFVNSFFGLSLTYAIKCNFEMHSVILFIGSLLFMLSDSVLSFKYFGSQRKEWYIMVELSLYYIGMLLISIFFNFM